MDITWSTEKNVNYDSCTESIRKNSQDKEDISTTLTQVLRTCDTLWSNNGQLQKYVSNIDGSDQLYLKFKV